jgi:hypothetical protein
VIGTVSIVLKDWPAKPAGVSPAVAAGQSAHFAVDVVYSDGSTEQVRGNLGPHLTAGQLSALVDFLAAMRAKAIAEIL